MDQVSRVQHYHILVTKIGKDLPVNLQFLLTDELGPGSCNHHHVLFKRALEFLLHFNKRPLDGWQIVVPNALSIVYLNAHQQEVCICLMLGEGIDFLFEVFVALPQVQFIHLVDVFHHLVDLVLFWSQSMRRNI